MTRVLCCRLFVISFAAFHLLHVELNGSLLLVFLFSADSAVASHFYTFWLFLSSLTYHLLSSRLVCLVGVLLWFVFILLLLSLSLSFKFLLEFFCACFSWSVSSCRFKPVLELIYKKQEKTNESQEFGQAKLSFLLVSVLRCCCSGCFSCVDILYFSCRSSSVWCAIHTHTQYIYKFKSFNK